MLQPYSTPRTHYVQSSRTTNSSTCRLCSIWQHKYLVQYQYYGKFCWEAKQLQQWLEKDWKRRDAAQDKVMTWCRDKCALFCMCCTRNICAVGLATYRGTGSKYLTLLKLEPHKTQGFTLLWKWADVWNELALSKHCLLIVIWTFYIHTSAKFFRFSLICINCKGIYKLGNIFYTSTQTLSHSHIHTQLTWAPSSTFWNTLSDMPINSSFNEANTYSNLMYVFHIITWKWK